MASHHESAMKMNLLLALNMEIDNADEPIFRKNSEEEENNLPSKKEGGLKSDGKQGNESDGMHQKLIFQNQARRKESVFNPIAYKNASLIPPTQSQQKLNQSVPIENRPPINKVTPKLDLSLIHYSNEVDKEKNQKAKPEKKATPQKSPPKAPKKPSIKKLSKNPVKLASSSIESELQLEKKPSKIKPSSLKASSGNIRQSGSKQAEVRFAKEDKRIEVPKLQFESNIGLDDISDDSDRRKQPPEICTITRPRINVFVGGNSQLNRGAKEKLKEEKRIIEDHNDLDELLENHLNSNFIQYVTQKDKETTAFFEMLIEKRKSANKIKMNSQKIIDNSRDARYQRFFESRFAFLKEKPWLNRTPDPSTKHEIDKFKYYFNQELSNQKQEKLEQAFVQNAMMYNNQFNRRNRGNLPIQGRQENRPILPN